MKSTKIVMCAFILLGAMTLPLMAFDKIPIAIMDFKVTNIEKSEFDLFLDFFSNSLFETGVFDVLQRDKRDKLMQEIQFSMSDTADAKKTRQVGKLLSSKLLVFGNLGKVGKNVLLSASIVDVETGRTVSTYSKTYKSLDEVFDSLPVVSNALADPAAQSVFMKKTNVLYFDDFTQQKWFVGDGYSYANGKYHLFQKDTDSYAWQQQIIDDFTIECEASFIDGATDSAYGLLYRFQDESNFYAFWLSASGLYSVVKYVKGEIVSIIPWTQSTAINKKSPNLLKISAFRNRFSISINNVLLKEFVDDTYRQGFFGVYAYNNVHAAFDNLIVYQGNLVFYDYFSNPSDNFFEGKIAYTKNGVYNIDNKDEKTFYYTWIVEPRKNISFKADALWRAGSVEAEYGITVRVQDEINNYAFCITKSGYYYFGYSKNGVFTYLVKMKKTRLINSEGINMLRVECYDDTFYLYLNENLVETVIDKTFSEGGIGFLANYGVNVAFDNAELFLLDQK